MLATLIAALALLAPAPASAAHLKRLKSLVAGLEAAHPNALWHIVHGLCVRDMKVNGRPAPCAEVDLAAGHALIRDVQRPTQYLLVPTTRIAGIESPALLARSSPNYWRPAWTARQRIEKQVGRAIPRDQIGLAVNSVSGRTQNQLHIHIDCVKPEVAQALAEHQAAIGPRWSRLGFSLAGRHYRARWVAGEDLGAADPFKLLARGDAVARADMSPESLAVIGATRADGTLGFIVLADRADADDADGGVAEQLLDHRCRILGKT